MLIQSSVSTSLQVTSISKKGEKFKLFVRGVLESFAYQLELASFGEVGNVSGTVLTIETFD